ncbi:hypothetical protein Tco_0083740 [Tanacetum coccineum]
MFSSSTVTYTSVHINSEPWRFYVKLLRRSLEEPIEGSSTLPADPGSPTALSPGYITDSDPEEDEEDPADHPVEGGDNDDNESSDDDDDDDDVEEDEEGEEHLAPADSFVVPIDDPVPSS